jgi:hypothetical protein
MDNLELEPDDPEFYQQDILYKGMISKDLADSILKYYQENDSGQTDAGSAYFPKRRGWRGLSPELELELETQLKTTTSQYYRKFNPNTSDPRIYHSNYGIVKPHRDIPTNPSHTHTCLIYLTDDFYGGVLSVKIPRSSKHLELFGSPEKKHLTISITPSKSYGVIFPKSMIHFNDELLGGDKIIMLIDCEIVY